MSPAGLAAERTALAWRRTAIAATVVAVLLVNHSVTSGWRPGAIASLGAAIAMTGVALLCYLRNRSLHEGRYGHGRTVVAATTIAITAVALVAVGIGLTDPQL